MLSKLRNEATISILTNSLQHYPGYSSQQYKARKRNQRLNGWKERGKTVFILCHDHVSKKP